MLYSCNLLNDNVSKTTKIYISLNKNNKSKGGPVLGHCFFFLSIRTHILFVIFIHSCTGVQIGGVVRYCNSKSECRVKNGE